MAVKPIRRWKRVNGGFVGWAECPCGVLTKMPADRCAGCGKRSFPMTLGRRKVKDDLSEGFKPTSMDGR